LKCKGYDVAVNHTKSPSFIYDFVNQESARIFILEQVKSIAAIFCIQPIVLGLTIGEKFGVAHWQSEHTKMTG